MQHTSFALAVLALIGLTHATPLAEPIPVDIPVSQDVQTKINQLRSQIVDVTDGISQNKTSNAKISYNSADTQFQAVGSRVKTPADYQCPPSNVTQPNSMQDAVSTLQSAQEDLDNLALHLQDTQSGKDLINNDFCTAYAAFRAVENIICTGPSGTSSSIAPNTASATPATTFALSTTSFPTMTPALNTTTSNTSMQTPSYNRTQLDQTYGSSLSALIRLHSAINSNQNNTQNAQSQDAFNNAKIALRDFQYVAFGNATLNCSNTQWQLDPPDTAECALINVEMMQRNTIFAYEQMLINVPEMACENLCYMNVIVSAVGSFLGC